jgi:death-on-curing family protein
LYNSGAEILFLELEPEVQAEYQRAARSLSASPQLSWPCLSVDDVLRAHYLIANHFLLEGTGIGGIGPKSPELLESAVCRQVASFGGKSKWEGLFEITATLFYGIIKNHAFHDANKRTAFLSALYQLHQGGYIPAVSEKIIEDFTVYVADNNLRRFSRYRDLLKAGAADPEVLMISRFFRDNTRKMDNKRYIVTYRELAKILGRYGYHLEAPENNYIDVVRYDAPRKLFGIFGSDNPVRVRVGRIGFPRWTAQVSASDIKAVRRMTGTSHEDGTDSGAFFHGLDDMQSLITSYNEPLKRLAFR